MAGDDRPEDTEERPDDGPDGRDEPVELAELRARVRDNTARLRELRLRANSWRWLEALVSAMRVLEAAGHTMLLGRSIHLVAEAVSTWRAGLQIDGEPQVEPEDLVEAAHRIARTRVMAGTVGIVDLREAIRGRRGPVAPVSGDAQRRLHLVSEDGGE
jgi:hypothetical protein